MIKPAMSVEDYVNKFAKLRIDALNHALKGIPEDRIRYHLCWGSWHGPHTHDLPFEHIIDLMLQVKAQCYSFEAANVRHEHEWRLWERTQLPDGKMLLPGVVSHSTNLIEHPELVAERIMRFAKLVGRENVIAGTDCGLGGRVHAEIAWAKLGALAEGAKLASKKALVLRGLAIAGPIYSAVARCWSTMQAGHTVRNYPLEVPMRCTGGDESLPVPSRIASFLALRDSQSPSGNIKLDYKVFAA